MATVLPQQTSEHVYDDESEESDEDYNMELYGMRQALPIPDGEPDWELEEPDTVEEYLRRVRWEAARVPKVVTAAIDATSYSAQQTAYIPRMESLPEPPAWAQIDHTWVQQFVQQFQQLRLYLAQVAEATVYSAPSLPHPNDLQGWDRLCFGRELPSGEEPSSSSTAPASGGSAAAAQAAAGAEPGGGGGAGAAGAAAAGSTAADPVAGGAEPAGSSNPGSGSSDAAEEEFPVPGPVMRVLQQLDQVAVVALLLRHIDQLAAGQALTLLRSQWLFALAARLDKPLHAETAAALRQLLRHCCGLRAALQRYDDPALPLLNILIAIAGAYFGQDEALTGLTGQDLL